MRKVTVYITEKSMTWTWNFLLEMELFGFGYAAIVAVGGVIGYVKAGSLKE